MGKEIPSDLLARLESGYSLPILSPVALRLVEMATGDDVSAKDLADLVEKDPSLAVRLLRLANSAIFKTSVPVTTLNQAIIKIGFQRLRIMALTVSLRDTFPMGQDGPMNYEAFWRVSLYRALMAKALADHLKICNPDEAFVAGLITEIGLLIFFDLLIKGTEEDIHLELDPLDELICWEKERYGVDHRQIGEAALRYWRFPDPIVLCQHAFRSSSGPEEFHPIARVCEQAISLSRIVSSGSEAFHTPYEEVEKSLGLDPSVVNDILLTTFQEIQEIADQLRVEMCQEKDLMGIMEKANSALSGISEKILKEQHSISSDPLPTFDSLGEGRDSTVRTLQAVAHEIRNPLLVVGGFARKLATFLDPDSAGGRYVQIILQESSRLEKALSEMVSPL
jgi:HD-like signal output (HDOD) protein